MLWSTNRNEKIRTFENSSESRDVIYELFLGYVTFTQQNVLIYQAGKSGRKPSKCASLLRQWAEWSL